MFNWMSDGMGWMDGWLVLSRLFGLAVFCILACSLVKTNPRGL